MSRVRRCASALPRSIEALRKLSDMGVPTAAPARTGHSSHYRSRGFVKGARENGASSLWTNTLHLGDVTRQAFFQYLGEKRPSLVPEYERLYRVKYAPKDYQRHVQEVVAALKARFGPTGPPRRSSDPVAPSTPRTSPVQIKLF